MNTSPRVRPLSHRFHQHVHQRSGRTTILHHFTKSTIHASNQSGPLLPYMGEHRYAVKVSSKTSNFTMGNAQEYCAANLGECKVNPIQGDGLARAKWMDGERGTESACLRLKIDKCDRNQCNSNGNNGRRAGFVCH